MGKEIERKFLVTKKLEDVFEKKVLKILNCSKIEQFYVEISEEREVRFRKKVTKGNKRFYKTVKSGGGLVRDEVETEVTEEEYERNLKNKIGNKIEKNRYLVEKMEIDVYKGRNDFFVVEMEFGDEEEAEKFVLPKGFFPFLEITSDKNWKNKNIALKGVPSIK